MPQRNVSDLYRWCLTDAFWLFAFLLFFFFQFFFLLSESHIRKEAREVSMPTKTWRVIRPKRSSSGRVGVIGTRRFQNYLLSIRYVYGPLRVRVADYTAVESAGKIDFEKWRSPVWRVTFHRRVVAVRAKNIFFSVYLFFRLNYKYNFSICGHSFGVLDYIWFTGSRTDLFYHLVHTNIVSILMIRANSVIELAKLAENWFERKSLSISENILKTVYYRNYRNTTNTLVAFTLASG